MSIIGSDIAVMGLGMSCQTAHQLRQNARMVAELIGEEVGVSRLPFDWMIAPPRSVAAMLRNDEFFPAAMSELQPGVRPHWPRYDCWFWHEEIAFDHPARFFARVSSAAEKMRQLARGRRRIFLVSNTQNALPSLAADAGGGVEIAFDDDSLFGLQAAADACFGPSELYAVTYAALDRTRHFPNVVTLTPDASEWQGDERQWAALLREIIVRPPPLRAAFSVAPLSRSRWSPGRSPSAASPAPPDRGPSGR